MPNYSNGKIYKLVNNVNNLIYIGSTINKLRVRFAGHKVPSKINNRKSKLYELMREIGKYNFKIILIENFSCNSKEELNSREQYWIDKLNPELNMLGAIFNEENRKTKTKIRNERYYKENKEETLKKQGKKYQCNCGKILTIGKKARHNKTKVCIAYQMDDGDDCPEVDFIEDIHLFL